jgi:DNA-binding protein HU-beta
MNKEEFAKSIGMKSADVNKVLDGITNALASGNPVQFVGFGTFDIGARAERKGRNPKTSEDITIPAVVYPKFSFGKPPKDKVAEGNKKQLKAMLKAKKK